MGKGKERKMENRKIVHDIKGKLSIVNTLANLVAMQHDAELAKERSPEDAERIHRMIHDVLEQCRTTVPEIVDMLEQIR